MKILSKSVEFWRTPTESLKNILGVWKIQDAGFFLQLYGSNAAVRISSLVLRIAS